MFTLRSTARLLKRLDPERSPSTVPPTNRLGDWYANLLHVGRLQVVLAVSEKTFLPVVVAAAPIATLVPRLRVGLGDVLRDLGIPKADIDREDAEMEAFVHGKTASRQVTGVMVDFGYSLELYVEDMPSLHAVAMKLSRTPCSPLFKTTVSPDLTTVALFGARPLDVIP